ncbi:MAG: YqgE/AlgH family protein [Fuerstiella sp.]
MLNSLEGHFLLAANHLRDPNFFQCVILMLEHTEETAMGLIVNRPMSTKLNEALGDLGSGSDQRSPLFSGGPVEDSSMFIMHNCQDLSTSDRTICDGVYVSSSSDSFDHLIQESVEVEQERLFRVYCGYAGWAGGQLEQEIDRGDWLTLPASSERVFKNDPYELWDNCMRELKAKHRILPQGPSDPLMN